MALPTCSAAGLKCHGLLFVGFLAATITAVTVASYGREGKARVEVLLSSSKTILDQPIAYPQDGQAKVTAVIVTMAPGQSTGWHKHDVPLFGYMLHGELTVDYGTHGKKIYRAGDSLLEALHVAHDGMNTGAEPARILAVFMGARGVPNTVTLTGPQ